MVIKRYRKIPKINTEALFEGLIFGGAYIRGAYLWRGICVSKLIGLPLLLEGNLPFLLCFALYLRTIPGTSPREAYIWRGDLTEGFWLNELGGLIFGGTYIWRGLFSDSTVLGLFANQRGSPVAALQVILLHHEVVSLQSICRFAASRN